MKRIKSAYLELVSSEQKGYYWGLATCAVVFTAFGRKYFRQAPYLTTIGSLFTGVIVYNLYSHKSRSHYAGVAQAVNKKASITLNKMMEYW